MPFPLVLPAFITAHCAARGAALNPEVIIHSSVIAIQGRHFWFYLLTLLFCSSGGER